MCRADWKGSLGAMTTTDFSAAPPPPPPPPAPEYPRRALRRSRTDRVGAGVAGGLGSYFDVDPVLFRVLFATSAFFGGVGIIAYVLAWAAIPEEGTTTAAVDGWIRALRLRRVPVWLVAVAAGLGLWLLAFSWWAPGPFFPAIVIALLLVAVAARRRPSADSPPWVATEPAAADYPPADGLTAPLPPSGPTWVGETRQWVSESRLARRERRRRSFPVRVATLSVLVVTLGILGAVDAASNNIALPVFFWVTLGIVTVGLFIGIIARRAPWSLTLLLIPAILGIIAFGSTDARLSDGFGTRDWVPTSAPAASYRLAFGQGTLDLRHVPTATAASTVDVTMAAGNVRIIAPPTMNLRVIANVHIGRIQVDEPTVLPNGGQDSGGINLQESIEPPAGASGAQLTVDVHLASGLISLEHAN